MELACRLHWVRCSHPRWSFNHEMRRIYYPQFWSTITMKLMFIQFRGRRWMFDRNQVSCSWSTVVRTTKPVTPDVKSYIKWSLNVIWKGVSHHWTPDPVNLMTNETAFDCIFQLFDDIEFTTRFVEDIFQSHYLIRYTEPNSHTR